MPHASYSTQLQRPSSSRWSATTRCNAVEKFCRTVATLLPRRPARQCFDALMLAAPRSGDSGISAAVNSAQQVESWKSVRLNALEAAVLATSFRAQIRSSGIFPCVVMRELDLQDCCLDEHGARALSEGIGSLAELERLTLRGNALCARGLEHIIRGLLRDIEKQPPQVRSGIRRTAAPRLFDSDGHVNTLTVCDNDVSSGVDQCGAPLLAGMHVGCSATKVPNGDGPASVVSDGVETNSDAGSTTKKMRRSRLQYLNVASCLVGFDDSIAATAYGTALTRDDTNMNGAGLAALAELLRHPCCGLRRVNLSKNRLSHSVLAPVLDALGENYSLRSISVAGSCCGPDAALVLLGKALGFTRAQTRTATHQCTTSCSTLFAGATATVQSEDLRLQSIPPRLSRGTTGLLKINLSGCAVAGEWDDRPVDQSTQASGSSSAVVESFGTAAVEFARAAVHLFHAAAAADAATRKASARGAFHLNAAVRPLPAFVNGTTPLRIRPACCSPPRRQTTGWIDTAPFLSSTSDVLTPLMPRHRLSSTASEVHDHKDKREIHDIVMRANGRIDYCESRGGKEMVLRINKLAEVSSDRFEELTAGRVQSSDSDHAVLYRPVLRTLKLRSNHLHVEALRQLMRGAVSGLAGLAELDISYNGLGCAGAVLLANALTDQRCRLRSISVVGCGLTEDGGNMDGIVAIASALEHNRTLESLDLGGNVLAPRTLSYCASRSIHNAVNSLARAFARSTTMRCLGLEGCWLDPTSVRLLRTAITESPLSAPFTRNIVLLVSKWLEVRTSTRSTVAEQLTTAEAADVPCKSNTQLLHAAGERSTAGFPSCLITAHDHLTTLTTAAHVGEHVIDAVAMLLLTTSETCHYGLHQPYTVCLADCNNIDAGKVVSVARRARSSGQQRRGNRGTSTRRRSSPAGHCHRHRGCLVPTSLLECSGESCAPVLVLPDSACEQHVQSTSTQFISDATTCTVSATQVPRAMQASTVSYVRTAITDLRRVAVQHGFAVSSSAVCAAEATLHRGMNLAAMRDDDGSWESRYFHHLVSAKQHGGSQRDAQQIISPLLVGDAAQRTPGRLRAGEYSRAALRLAAVKAAVSIKNITLRAQGSGPRYSKGDAGRPTFRRTLVSAALRRAVIGRVLACLGEARTIRM